MIDISGMDKGEVLAALYNASKPLGLGILHFNPKPMTSEEGRELIRKTDSFDYLKGRVMKVYLEKDHLDPWLFDRDNGEGAAQRAIAAIKSISTAA